MSKHRTARDLAGILRNWIANPERDQLDGVHEQVPDLQDEWLLEHAAEVSYKGEPGRNHARLIVSTDAGIFEVTVTRKVRTSGLSTFARMAAAALATDNGWVHRHYLGAFAAEHLEEIVDAGIAEKDGNGVNYRLTGTARRTVAGWIGSCVVAGTKIEVVQSGRPWIGDVAFINGKGSRGTAQEYRDFLAMGTHKATVQTITLIGAMK